MKKHFLNVLLLLALVATTGMLITSCKDYDDDINQLNDRIDQFEKDKIGSVEEQVAAIKSSISSLEAAYKAADTELKKELENQVSALNEAKKELEASIKSQIESQKNSHDQDIEDLITKLNDLDKKVVENHESLSLEINKVAGNLATTKSALETIDEAVKALQNNSATKAEIQKLTSDLKALSTNIEGYNTSLAADIKKVADDLNNDHYTKTEIDAKLAELEKKFNNSITAELAILDSKFSGEIAGLNDRLMQCEGAILAIDAQIQIMNRLIDGKVDQADFDALNEQIKKMQDQIKTMKEEIAGKVDQSDFDVLQKRLENCEGVVLYFDAQIQIMKGLIDGKVDKSDYEIFTQVTNNAIQRNAQDIALLAAICAEFEGTTIKEYIDKAIKDVTETLTAFKDEYKTFTDEYGKFKTDIEGRVATAKGEIDALNNWKKEMTEEGGTLDVLEKKLQEAIDEKTTLDKVKAEFTKESDAFLAGVNGVIEEALKEGGLINSELTKKLNDLRGDYEGTIKDLSDKVAALTDKVTNLEGSVNALVGQIQSLVYVPEFADGTTEMRSYSFGENTVDVPVKLTFRVSPANMAKEMEKLFDAGALTLVTEEVKTRADAAPTAQIMGVEVVNEAAGTFTVQATIENYPADANKAVAVALAVNANIGETKVANDVVSNFGGVVKAETVELEFALFDAKSKYEGANIEMPWNKTQADSKREILKDLKLKVSLDKGENYMTLEEASNEIGTDIVADKYTTTSDPEKTDENFEIFNVEDEDWGSENHPWVQFAKANGTSELVGEAVEFTYTIKAKLGENEAVNAVYGTVTYTVIKDRIVNEFEKLTLPWTYGFVKNGIGAKDGADTPTPKVEFDEIALTNLPESVDLAVVLAETPEIKVNGEDAPEAGFTFAAGEKKGIKVAVEMDKYEWGKTYDIVYTYKKDETEYIFKGQIEFGPAPEAVEYNYSVAELGLEAVTVGYEDKTIDMTWEKVYGNWEKENGKWNESSFFENAGQFTAAILTGTTAPTPEKETRLINADNKEPGKVVSDEKGTKITCEIVSLKGELKKADITGEGDKFVQTATWNTWYGQKITVTITYNIDLPEYRLIPNEAFVKNNTVTTMGEVDAATEKWSVKLQGAVEDYFSFTPESDDVKMTFEKTSKDTGDKKYAEVTEGGEHPTVTWTMPTTTEKDLDMTVKLVLGEKAVVAEQNFTIEGVDPIKTFEQTKAIEKVYENNTEMEIDLLTGILLIDANGKNWIGENGVPVKTPINEYTAKDVFGMTGDDAKDVTAGIVFDIENNGGLKLLRIEDNKLKYTTDNTVLLQEVSVKIRAKITYWLGKEKTTTVTVVIKPVAE